VKSVATVLVKKSKKNKKAECPTCGSQINEEIWGMQYLDEGKPLKGKTGKTLFQFPSKSTKGNWVVREWERKKKTPEKQAAPLSGVV
jgi:hypothetical protein